MIAENLAALRQQLGTARLIAVSKGHDSDSVREALAAGQRIFGENRVQEAEKKFGNLRGTFPDLELHLIGPLQSNKAEEAVALFDVIQTLDRLSLAQALVKAISKTGKKPRLYIEINIGQEAQKAGIAPDKAEDFLQTCREMGLKISGLMCIPPQHEDPTPHFTRMRALQKKLKLENLSMGMSDDYDKAIACGASEVRIGARVFGERKNI